jgi:hypothetical protein
MRRLAVVLCIAGILVTLAVALAAAAEGGDPLELGIVGIDARVGGDLVHGSGAVIDADKGLVLTSARSVWGSTSLKLTTGVGVLHGRIVARAPCSNLAVLEMQPRIPGLEALKGGGTLTQPLDVVARDAGGSVQHVHAAAGAGAQAATIVDRDGRMAGIATAEGVVPWALIDQRLSELQPGPRRVYVGWRDEYACTPALNVWAKKRHPGFRDVDAVLNAPVPASRVPGTGELDR